MRAAFIICLTLPMFLTAGPALAGGHEAPATDTQSVIDALGLELDAVALRDNGRWRKPEKIVVRQVGPLNGTTLAAQIDGVEFVTATSPKDALDHIADADAMIGFCTPDLLARGEKLQWVHITSAGVENCVDLPELQGRDLTVTNMQKVSSSAIAEHVMAFILTFSRDMPRYWAAQQKSQWAPPELGQVEAWELQDKTILIAGLGGIGSQVARRAKALGMRVTATRNSSREGPDYVDYVGLSDELLTLAAEARVVVNALPLTAETTELFDSDFFDAMREDAYFINVGRGGSVDTGDLAAALMRGKIAGAALDVTEPEPLPDHHVLWKMPNVLITPHVAAGSDIVFGRYMTVVMENTRRFVNGDALYNVVDVDLGY